MIYSSARQNNYHYGISTQESRHSGLASYDAGDSWDPYIEMTAVWSLSASWNVTVSGRYTRLNNEIKNSPMVGKNGLFSMWTGVSYTF